MHQERVGWKLLEKAKSVASRGFWKLHEKFKSIASRCIKTLFKVTLQKAKGVASRAC